MAAPNPYVLLDFETQMESAWKAIITGELAVAAITGVQVVTSRDDETEDTPRIMLQFQLNAPLDQRTTANQPGPAKKQVPAAYQGTLVATIATTRPIATDNAEIHGLLRGLVRYCLSAAPQALNDSNLPWLQVLDQQPANSTPQIQDDKQQDMSVLAYNTIFAVRNEAWPPQPTS